MVKVYLFNVKLEETRNSSESDQEWISSYPKFSVIIEIYTCKIKTRKVLWHFWIIWNVPTNFSEIWKNYMWFTIIFILIAEWYTSHKTYPLKTGENKWSLGIHDLTLKRWPELGTWKIDQLIQHPQKQK